jgi:hypothetical protein
MTFRNPELRNMSVRELLNELGKRVTAADEDRTKDFRAMGLFKLLGALQTDDQDGAAFELVRRSRAAGFDCRIGDFFRDCCGLRDGSMIQ